MMQSENRKKRLLAGMLGMVFLVAVLLSTFYLVAEAGHDCTGEDCPICACMQQCENTLHTMAYGGVLAVVAVLPMFLLFFRVLSEASKMVQETPVTRKVRMNN